MRAGRACGVPQFQLPQRTPGQTRQARDGRRGPPGGAWAGPGAHCGVGPAWVLGLFIAETPSQGARWSAKRHSLSKPSQVAIAPTAPCSAPSRAPPLEGPLRGQGRRATGRPSPSRSRRRAAWPDQPHRRLCLFPSPTSSSSWVDARPPRRHRRPLRLHRRRPDGEYVVPRASSTLSLLLLGKCDEGEDAEETREAITMIVEAGPAWEQQQAGQPEKPGEQAEVEQLLSSTRSGAPTGG